MFYFDPIVRVVPLSTLSTAEYEWVPRAQVFYLDPHFVRPFADVTPGCATGSFHYAQPTRRMSLADIDPSLALGFYCQVGLSHDGGLSCTGGLSHGGRTSTARSGGRALQRYGAGYGVNARRAVGLNAFLHSVRSIGPSVYLSL